MATTYKVLGQVEPTGNTRTEVFACNSTASAVVSTVVICNRGISTTYRLAVQPANAAIANTHYVVYDATIAPNDTAFLTLGLTLAPTDVLSVNVASGNTTTVSAYGTLIT